MRNGVWLNLMLAGAMIAAPLLMNYLSTQGFVPEGEISQRSMGVVLGLLVIAMASASSKRVKPLADMQCDPSREQSARRFSGQALVLAGLGWVIAWIAAPFDLANPLAMSILGGVLLLVIARCFAGRSARQKS